MASQPEPFNQHRLNPSKGWPSNSALDSSYKISDNVDYDMRPGQCGHLNSVGEIEPGCVAWQMPLFLFGGAASLDVMNTPGTNWWPISPGGRVACFPGKAPLELWTTEFDDQTYACNDPLRSPTGLTSGDEFVSGMLTNQGVKTVVDTIASSSDKWTAIVGIACIPSNPAVSQGSAAVTSPVYTNCDGVDCLAFWPVHYPGHPTQTV